jgi:hypothetical protein
MAGQSVAALVDALIAADKTLEGQPDWRPAGNGDEQRLILPIFIDGTSTEASVEINAYPNAADLAFRVMLRVEKCVWRIDYTDWELHVNPVDTFSTIDPYSFTEPHFHSWADNRRYCTVASLPSRLKIARPLPARFRGFDAAFRWFCGEVNIAQPPSGMVYLPQRTRLI